MDDYDAAGSSGRSAEDQFASTNDAELLKLAWRNEKAAPEILPFEEELLQRVQEQVVFQVRDRLTRRAFLMLGATFGRDFML